MDTQVLIVGAGPTGLALALWLSELGIDVRIIDKNAAPGEHSRATAVQARTLELYETLGIGKKIADLGIKVRDLNLWAAGAHRTHIKLGSDEMNNLFPFPFFLVFPQDLHERVLIDELKSRGIEILRNTELISFTQSTDVTATICTKGKESADPTTTTVKAAYLVGCDGTHSTVRSALGATFDGGTYDNLFYVAEVKVKGSRFDTEMHAVLEGRNYLVAIPFGGNGKVRLVGTASDLADPDSKIQFEDVNRMPQQTIGLEVEEVNWFSTYHAHHRVVDKFQHKRAFLIGDAAHVNIPVGGQGMNTGIGDAVNLSWKLAAVLKGHADESLLETVDSERCEFAHSLLKTTDSAFRLMAKQGVLAEFVRVHLAPVFIDAANQWEPVTKVLFKVISQMEIRYSNSALSVGNAGSVKGGDRLPFVRFSDTDDNYKSLKSAKWRIHIYGEATEELLVWSGLHGIPLTEYPWCEALAKAGFVENALYLLRPDTYVGLASLSATPSDLEAYFKGIHMKLTW